MARLNIELAHGLLMRLMLATHVDEETGEAAPIVLSPEDAMFVARAVQSLASASKTTEDRIEKRIEKARAEERNKAADNAATAARSKGLSKETVDAIRFAVLGSDA